MVDIERLWFNELKSGMAIKGARKTLSGKYFLKVGDVEGEYDLVGFVDQELENDNSIG